MPKSSKTGKEDIKKITSEATGRNTPSRLEFDGQCQAEKTACNKGQECERSGCIWGTLRVFQYG